VYSVVKIPAIDWRELSKQAHFVTFGEYREGIDRVDYALLCMWDGATGGYVTVKEMDKDTAYIQHGGVFPDFQKSIYAFGGFVKLLKVLKSDYKRVWTRVVNTNIPMIKLALSQGFVITGCTFVCNKLYLEMNLEV
jgi:hypothetical protein